MQISNTIALVTGTNRGLGLAFRGNWSAAARPGSTARPATRTRSPSPAWPPSGSTSPTKHDVARVRLSRV